MQKVLYMNQVEEVKDYVAPKVVEYISDGQIETFESFPDFDIIAFDWYDINGDDLQMPQILIYIDKDDFFVFCENEASYNKAVSAFVESETNERAMYQLFRNIFKGDMKYIEGLEDKMNAMDETILVHIDDDTLANIVDMRQEVLCLKKYYEQLSSVFEDICENENELLNEDYIHYFEILENRIDKLLSNVVYLREYITQIRESYQAQIDIQTNNLMKVFTFVTAIFMPLSLIAGWYGMNFFNMPELTWKYGYLAVILVCVLICVLWFVYFKKKKWFK